MVSPAVNKQLLSFLFFNTLDLKYSRELLSNTLLKNHSKIENLNDSEVYKNILKKLLLKELPKQEVELEEFSKHCKEIFENHDSFNFNSWFLFYKRSLRRERETFILSQILKMNDTEISELQNLTAGTVRSRLSSCYDKFTEAIKNG